MSKVDFDVDFKISEPPADASEHELKNHDSMKLMERVRRAEEKCAQLEESLGKHMVRASSLSAMKDEASRAWVRIGELERKCDALGRVNEDLEERCTELRRRLAHRASNADLAQAQVCIERAEARCAELEKELAASKRP